LRFRKIVVERVTVVKFGVDNRGSDGTGRFRIEVRTDTAELRQHDRNSVKHLAAEHPR